MATLTNTKIKDTYDGLLKTNDNGVLGGTSKEITDGLGNGSGIYIGTNQRLGVGKTPDSGSLLDVNGDIKLAAGAKIKFNDDRYFSPENNVDGAEISANGVFKVKTGATPTERMRIESDGAVVLKTSDQRLRGGDTAGRLVISNSTTTSYISLTGSTHTSADEMDFVTNSALAIKIDSSGNVGIGTSSPTTPIHILSSTDIATFESSTTGLYNTYKNSNKVFGYVGTGSQTISGGGANDFGIQSSDNFLIATGGNAERMRITSSGTIQTNVTKPFGSTTANLRLKLTPTGTNYSSGAFFNIVFGDETLANSYLGDIQVVQGDASASTSSSMRFLTNSGGGNSNTLERMRISSGGQLQVGGTAQSFNARIVVHRDIYSIESRSTGTGSEGHLVFRNANGAVGSIITSGSSTAYNTSSDYRLKKDWQPMDNALDRVNTLKPVNFAWKADGSRVDGFLAHELAEVIPEAVTGEKDATEEYEIAPAVLDLEGNVIEEAVMGTRDVYQGIDQSKIVPLLVAAIQELKGLVQSQQAEIELLKN